MAPIVNLFGLLAITSSVFSRSTINYQTPADCKVTTVATEKNEVFDFSQMQCIACAQTSAYQGLSRDGLSCVCKKGYKLIKDFGGSQILCSPCGANEVTSSDGWGCVRCGVLNSFNPVTQDCQACTEGVIAVERLLDGTWNTDATSRPARTCKSCQANTSPNQLGTRCERCNQVLSMLPSASSCKCPVDQQAGGLCFPSPTNLIPDTSDLYKVTYDDGTQVESGYFQDNLKAAEAMCQSTYKNLTACQTLGNMCVYLMYKRDNVGQTSRQDACSLYENIRGNIIDWPENMPWLYYMQQKATQVLEDDQIPTEYTFNQESPNHKLNFLLAKYSLNGTFLGYSPVAGGALQLCQDTPGKMDAAWVFGLAYSQKCTIDVKDLWDSAKYEAVFYDMYLEYTVNNVKKLFAVPVVIKNYKNSNGQKVNTGAEYKDWQLTRRFFLVDNMSGRKKTTTTSGGVSSPQVTTVTYTEAEVVQYATSISINIRLQKGTTLGKIYPPYLTITYGNVKLQDKNSGKKVAVDFDVTYSMNLEKYNYDLSVAVGVLSAFAVVYAGLLTWGWSKRSSQMVINFETLMKLVVFACGTLSNVFFVVTLGVSLWWLIFYKRQDVVYLILPNRENENTFVAYLAAAFALKSLQLLAILANQITVDLFFIDWERPQARAVSNSGDTSKKGEEAPVSIWRTYFAANEWNEIQTIRKINSVFQIFAVVFFLHIVGFENFASMDPYSLFSRPADQFVSQDSRICRFALGTAVYLLVAVTQWIFYTFIYERFIEDQVRQYVDLCSMANISVFVCENSHFGYYIHGRSPHGRADTGIKEMHNQMKREEDDMCGTRGLLPNTDQQTFQIALPTKLRTQYEQVLATALAPTGQVASRMERGGGGVGGGAPGGSIVDKQVQSYQIINRFLQSYIDHSLRNIDYIVKDRLLLESILNVEFEDASQRGIFYNDDGHSFDQVLLFGHETTLTLFQVLFFALIDLASQNFILAGVCTYLIGEVIFMIRDIGGRKNLAKKTLVDERFLI